MLKQLFLLTLFVCALPAYAGQLQDLNGNGQLDASDVLLLAKQRPTTSLSAALPDTITVDIYSAEPGGVSRWDVGVKFRTLGAGGFLLVLSDLPSSFGLTNKGVDLTEGGTAPEEIGSWWYEWTSFGKSLKSLAAASLVLFDNSHALTIYILGTNVDLLAQIGEEIGGINADKSGTVVSIYFRVPASEPEGTYPISVPEGGAAISKHPLAEGLFLGLPIVIVDDIVIREEPEYHPGDVNRDGAVNIFDLLELLKILAEDDF